MQHCTNVRVLVAVPPCPGRRKAPSRDPVRHTRRLFSYPLGPGSSLRSGRDTIGRYAILLLISPIFSIQIFTTSPALRNSPRPAPTPAGVPVSTRSPGCRVSREERWEICSASVKIILLVWESCLSTSLTQSLSARPCGSLISLAGTIQGPSGQEPSKLLCATQSALNGEVSLICGRRPRSRAERSLAQV